MVSNMNGDSTRPEFKASTMLEKAQGAFIAAAVGDALGWPNEYNARRVGHSEMPAHSMQGSFRAWTRREGNRYAAYEVEIGAGEYSDDTQLLLCVARSLLASSNWWEHLTTRELPAWIVYERGGGGALKRSARAWATGVPPWTANGVRADPKGYLDAGGNGVVMRILPHCIRAASGEDFSRLAHDIVADGVTTHGHPRALVGALALGYALWCALQHKGELPYGHLIRATMAARDAWSPMPDISQTWPNWRKAADSVTHNLYEGLWWETVDEMQGMLEQIASMLENLGALSVGDSQLAQLGCFDKSRNGAGTITTAAALLLASAYAADPAAGLFTGAFTSGADSDTLACTTGTLLGAIAGVEWLGEQATQVQDAGYIRSVAERLTSGPQSLHEANTSAGDTPSPELTVRRLDHSTLGESIALPDGRLATISDVRSHRTRTMSIAASSWKLVADDGQTLFISKVSRQQEIESQSPVTIPTTTSLPVAKGDSLATSSIVNAGVRLYVRSIDQSRTFYANILGLLLHDTDGSIRIGTIQLVPIPARVVQSNGGQLPSAHRAGATLVIEARSLSGIYDRAQTMGAPGLSPLTERPGLRSFRCIDPDGNVVELIERDHTETLRSNAGTASSNDHPTDRRPETVPVVAAPEATVPRKRSQRKAPRTKSMGTSAE